MSKFSKFFVSISLVIATVFSAKLWAASPLEVLSKQCNYTQTSAGEPLTYRGLLDIAAEGT
jgi:hypothetical protein